ncbi:armadillo repeat-containing protein 6 [Canna indica]|uniref:Armadillo repeat-containing protein 6 n=1 Tax=Canna indica TaxID=4628 RepID=A0AAQ3QSM4_9LILI|nr:armadillo repeat-containing protein 6 [Canna indica]
MPPLMRPASLSLLDHPVSTLCAALMVQAVEAAVRGMTPRSRDRGCDRSCDSHLVSDVASAFEPGGSCHVPPSCTNQMAASLANPASADEALIAPTRHNGTPSHTTPPVTSPALRGAPSNKPTAFPSKATARSHPTPHHPSHSSSPASQQLAPSLSSPVLATMPPSRSLERLASELTLSFATPRSPEAMDVSSALVPVSSAPRRTPKPPKPPEQKNSKRIQPSYVEPEILSSSIAAEWAPTSRTGETASKVDPRSTGGAEEKSEGVIAMGPSAGGRTISQEAFEALVAENIEDLGMEPDEALEDALQTLTLQGVDLSGIIKCIPGVSSTKDNPVIQTLDKLKGVVSSLGSSKWNTATKDPNSQELVKLIDTLYGLCSIEGSDNATITSRNGGVELLTSICSSLDVEFETPLTLSLKALSSILHDIQTRELFRQNGGPKIVADILKGSSNPVILDSCFAVVVAASTSDEILKELFIDLKIDEIVMKILKEHSKDNLYNLYDAIRVLLTPDDNRVVASQVYGYARQFAKVGIADVLVKALCEGLSLSSLSSACIALKAVAVNDEICKSIAESGGIDATLQCLDESCDRNNKTIARTCCSLLSKLAGSDANKNAIVEIGGLDRLMKLSSKFSEDPSVLQEVMCIITVLSLRSPENAARAVEAGAADLVLQAMQKFPTSFQMQRQACLMIRNLVVRNPENRTILINNGIEKLIRKAKGSHESCKDAATAALRDLGLDDYNT